jgi:RHS repeat-associated protein
MRRFVSRHVCARFLPLVVLAALALLPGRAAAQCQEEPCGPVDTTNPVITISPSSGSFPAGARSVTIDWSDDNVLNHNSREITLVNASGTQNVTGNFSYSTSNGSTAVSTGTITIGTGTNTLTAYICDMSAYGPNCFTQTATFSGPAPPPPSATVTTETPAAVVAAGTRGALRYRLTNTGTAQGTFTLGASCPAGFTLCAPSETSVMLSAGAAAWVDVSFTTPASASSGPVQLTTLSGTVSGTTTVTVPAAPSPGYPGDAASLLRIQRDACVVVSTGPGTASECGDLRVAHALPSVRVLNKARTPVLTYNSDHAWPNPIVAAQFAGPAGTVPDSIRATLLVNGTQVAQRRWKGWGATQTRRIALSFLANDTVLYKTGVYAYSLVVTAEWLNGTQAPLDSASRTGRMIIVNRSLSPFGAGWWLSGVEQVFPLSNTEKLWVGGDGSARLYQGTSAAGPWTADAYDGVDVLTAGAGGLGYVRLLPGGAKVHFSNSGYHVATENALGHVTQFVWLSEGSPEEMRLKSVVLPSASAHPETLSYLFEYGTVGPGCTTSTTALTRVRSPAPGSGYQDSWLCGDNLRRVRRIGDPTPGSTSVSFGYYQSTRWMTQRTDRSGVVQSLGYSKVRFHNAVQPLSAGVTANTVVAAVQTLGMNGVSVNADSVHIVFDGPRPGTEVCDCMWWKVDRWGAPTSMRNPLGQVTTVRRGDGRWPGLVTETVAPNGFRTTARYDVLGYLASTTAWGPYNDSRNATTTYEWNPAAAAPTKIMAPEGEVTQMGYDAQGRREWEQVGPDAGRRVNYYYYNIPHPVAPGLVRSVALANQVRDSIDYDLRGNLSATFTPQDTRVDITNDRIGRSLVTRTPVNGYEFQYDSVFYNAIGQVDSTVSRGGTQRLVVDNTYYPDGALKSVSRWSQPDTADVDTITTQWEYDLAGRKIVEIAPDGMRDSTFYDRAGNVVEVRTRRRNSGGVMRMQYDALNRLTHRMTDTVHYAARDEGLAQRAFQIGQGGSAGTQPPPYPWYPNDGGTGYRIPGDVAEFTYNSTGGMLSAVNRDARVNRSYYDGGALRGDTLRIRTVAELSEGGNFTNHVYGLEFTYDRNGRRTEIKHPEPIAPRLNGVLKDRTTYGYDPLTGALARVTDPLGTEFRYHYNHRGEVDTLYLPGNVSESSRYDRDGRLVLHQTHNPAAGGADRYTANPLRRDTLTYAVRGKLLSASNTAGPADSLAAEYSTMGHLKRSTTSSQGLPTNGIVPSSISEELPVHDALGNQVSRTSTSTFSLNGYGRTTSPGTETFRYHRGTGRLRSKRTPVHADTLVYDAGGNLVWETYTTPGLTAQDDFRDRAYFYGADGKLRASDVRDLDDPTNEVSSNYTRSFEEYRYDALGRRVLTSARRNCRQPPFSGYCQLGFVRRTVWDGNQELFEIQAPESGDVPYYSQFRENDTGHLKLGVITDEGGNVDPNPMYGRVLYTHGLTLDQPLGVVRMGYGDTVDVNGEPRRWRAVDSHTLVPHWNSRGQAVLGTYEGARYRLCETRDGHLRCVIITWPEMWAGYTRGRILNKGWHGTLLTDKGDASGLNYRRNRYYDPASGRFTQEDPIGLAGGVNVYGFANGDPVSYRDPYGLKIECTTRAACRLQRQVERAITQGVNSRDADVRQAALGLSGVVNALDNAPQVIELHAHSNGAVDRFLGRNVFSSSVGRFFSPLNYTGRCTYVDAHCTVAGARATVWLETSIMRNISAGVRLVHELGHVYAHEIEGVPWEANSQNRAIEIENLYRTIQGCRSRPPTASDGGWAGPRCP